MYVVFVAELKSVTNFMVNNLTFWGSLWYK